MKENSIDQSEARSGAGAIMEPWGFSAVGRRDEESSAGVAPEAKVPSGFRMRLVISISFVFLGLMLVFLSLSFVSERRLHHRLTFEHLDEALEILTIAIGSQGAVPVKNVVQIESKLSERTGIEHRLIITDVNGSIQSASISGVVGQNIESVVRLDPQVFSNGFRAYGRYDNQNWLVAAIPRSALFAGDRLFLLRTRAGSEQFIREFAKIHGLHVLVTLLAVGGLVHFIGRRYVRQPILQLASSIQRIEAGDLTADVSVIREDEFGWLAGRFAEMGVRLKDAIRRLVRSEKYASVSIVTFRIGRRLYDPLRSLERHIAYIDAISSGNRDLERIAMALRQDRVEIMGAIRQLEEIEPPGE